MNHTVGSIRSSKSSSLGPKKSFRVIVKNRITHQNVEPETQKSRSQLLNIKQTIDNDSFQQAKDNLKKYIRNMKASSKLSNYESKMNTNRSSCPYIQKQSNLVSSRAKSSSRKHANKLLTSSFIHAKDSGEDSHYNNQSSRQYLNQDLPSSLLTPDNKLRCLTESNQEGVIGKLPVLRSAFQQYQQTQNIYDNKPPNGQSSSRHRLSDLQNKIQSLLIQKLRILSSTDSFSSNQKQNKTAFKLLQKQMDRILDQIRKVKQAQQTLNNQSIYEQDSRQKDTQINKNIEMLQKKVKILQRLIADKLFQADNLKNQFLIKMKQHNRNKSQMPYSRNSRSSTFYRQANMLNPSNFIPSKHQKQTVCASQMTTNKADFKTPLKSYYISPKRDNFYNSNTLTQPLPRSTYNRQYLIYGTLPKDLVRMRQTRKDHRIFSSTMSPDQQKNMLEGSTYKEDFITKTEKHPTNFKELDAYKDKFKSLQVNYGKEKNNEKVGNSKSVLEYYEEDKHYKLNTENPQRTLPSLQVSDSKKYNLRVKLQQLTRPLIQNLNMTQNRVSMIEQQSIQKHHLFNQRIKSEIKHKNLHDQKYKFKSELLREKIKKYVGAERDSKMHLHQTVAY